ncbi:Uma2 family endonuclease [Nocardia nova]|uniref:Uma2 family endonuclease n=1 Tax=Nocardia nova TaxID=37330 RepID=UPI003CCBB8B9
MHQQVTAAEYDSWPEERCARMEIVAGIAVVSPSASKRHNRLARVLANALDAASGPEWNADTDFDARLQDVPLTNRRPDVVVYRADTIDVTPTRPEHVLLVAEVVSPGSETTDRIVKVDQYAKGGYRLLLASRTGRDRRPADLHPHPRPGNEGISDRRDVHGRHQGGGTVHCRHRSRRNLTPRLDGGPVAISDRDEADRTR